MAELKARTRQFKPLRGALSFLILFSPSIAAIRAIFSPAGVQLMAKASYALIDIIPAFFPGLTQSGRNLSGGLLRPKARRVVQAVSSLTQPLLAIATLTAY